MKKGVVFALGILTGCVIMLIGRQFEAKPTVGSPDSNGETSVEETKIIEYPGLTLYEQPRGIVEGEYYKVEEVIDLGVLARTGEKSKYSETIFYDGPIVLFLSDENSSYYDDQIIHITSGKLQQLGVYKHHGKTVPVVREP